MDPECRFMVIQDNLLLELVRVNEKQRSTEWYKHSNQQEEHCHHVADEEYQCEVEHCGDHCEQFVQRFAIAAELGSEVGSETKDQQRLKQKDENWADASQATGQENGSKKDRSLADCGSLFGDVSLCFSCKVKWKNLQGSVNFWTAV